MTDLPQVLPDFDLKPYSHLLHSLNKNNFTVADLITCDPTDIAKECPLPLGEVRKLVAAVSKALQQDVKLSIATKPTSIYKAALGTRNGTHSADRRARDGVADTASVKTLDKTLDEALGGGIHLGYVTEIAGESSAGKTQLAMGLLLSAQLQPPLGLGRGAIYISTESSLNTTRLHQVLASHPLYLNLPESGRPTLNRIYTIAVHDVEAQDHIIEFQLPLAIQRYNIGLVVVDSVAANYRAEYETKTASGLAERAWDLGKLGKMLRTCAVQYNVAVVVTNQVADRFDDPLSKMTQELFVPSSPAAPSSPALGVAKQSRTPRVLAVPARLEAVMELDHQQRFFTGWGNERTPGTEDQKTPALGLVWANQIGARIVLRMEGILAHSARDTGLKGKRKRYLSVVFAPWARPSDRPVEYEIGTQGLISISEHPMDPKIVRPQETVVQSQAVKAKEDLFAKDPSLLDPATWQCDGADEDDEYPF